MADVEDLQLYILALGLRQLEITCSDAYTSLEIGLIKPDSVIKHFHSIEIFNMETSLLLPSTIVSPL